MRRTAEPGQINASVAFGLNKFIGSCVKYVNAIHIQFVVISEIFQIARIDSRRIYNLGVEVS